MCEKQRFTDLVVGTTPSSDYVLQNVSFKHDTGEPPATSRSPINQNGTMAKDALLQEKFISAECVR